MNQPTLPVPNPQDWCDIPQAAVILNRSRATVYDMAERGVLTIHKIGAVSLVWRAEAEEVAQAVKRLSIQRQAGNG